MRASPKKNAQLLTGGGGGVGGRGESEPRSTDSDGGGGGADAGGGSVESSRGFGSGSRADSDDSSSSSSSSNAAAATSEEWAANSADARGGSATHDSHYLLALLTRDLHTMLKHPNETPPRKYSYEKWARYLKLIGAEAVCSSWCFGGSSSKS